MEPAGQNSQRKLCSRVTRLGVVSVNVLGEVLAMVCKLMSRAVTPWTLSSKTEFPNIRLSKRSSGYDNLCSCLALSNKNSLLFCHIVWNNGRLAHAVVFGLSAAECPLCLQLAQRHETMVFIVLTHPSCLSKHVFLFHHWARLRPSPQHGLHFWSDLTVTPGGMNLWARFSQMRMSAPTILWLSRCVLV